MKRVVATVSVVLAALLLAGCSISGGGSGADSIAHDSKGTAAGPEVAADQPGSVTVQTRQVVTTGSVSLTVGDPVDAAQKAADIVEAAGGRVDDRSEQPASGDQQASARLTLRIPSDRLTPTLAKIKKLGTVESVSTSSKDVTTAAEDLDARIAALQTSVDRLLELMAKAADAGDLLKIESALSERQANLESLQAQRKTLAGQVELATIALQLSAERTVATTVPGDFWSGLAAGWNALLVAAAGFLVFLGVALPWLGVLVIAGVIVWIVLRTKRRHRSAPAGGDAG